MEFDAMVDQFYIQMEDELLGEDWLDSFATVIKDAKHERVDVASMINTFEHLNQAQKDDLLKVLQKHQKTFDGTSWVWVSTLKLILMQNQFLPGLILFHRSI